MSGQRRRELLVSPSVDGAETKIEIAFNIPRPTDICQRCGFWG
jgi:hypothetical protein